MKSYRSAAFIATATLAFILLGLWQARQVADRRRADEVIRFLCKEIRVYQQHTGHLPTTLDLLADGKMVDADRLRKVTNTLAITYDPGSSTQQRMPQLTVSVGHTSIAVQGPVLEYPPR